MASENSPLYVFYFRYKWSYVDFTGLQNALINLQRDMLGALAGPALINGGAVAPSGSTRAVTVAAYIAINSSGYLNVSNSTVLASVTANSSGNPRKDLIVARPLIANGTMITRPTSPFDSVPLTQLQGTQVVVIAGTPAGSPAYPSKQSGDVIIAGLAVANGATSFSSGNIDTTVTELISTNTNFSNWVVGKDTHGTAALTGDSGATRATLSLTPGNGQNALQLNGSAFLNGTQIANNTAQKNLLQALSIPKALASIGSGGAGPALNNDDINISSVTATSTYIEVTLAQGLNVSAGYALVQDNGDQTAFPRLFRAYFFSSTKIRIVVMDSAFAVKNPSTDTYLFTLLVFGKQT